eukprot:9211245-Lingulodinium_polyedra.AAC.1
MPLTVKGPPHDFLENIDQRVSDALLEQGVRCKQPGKLRHPWLLSLSESRGRVGQNQCTWHGHSHFTLQWRGAVFVVLCSREALKDRGWPWS